MSVDEAMETAKAYLTAREQMQEPLFESEEVAVTLAKEVERLRAEVEMSHSFHRVAVKERDFERLLVEALKEELAAAKAASECPVELVALGDAEKDWWHCDVNVKCKSGEDADKLCHWLRDRMKDATPPAT